MCTIYTSGTCQEGVGSTFRPELRLLLECRRVLLLRCQLHTSGSVQPHVRYRLGHRCPHTTHGGCEHGSCLLPLTLSPSAPKSIRATSAMQLSYALECPPALSCGYICGYACGYVYIYIYIYIYIYTHTKDWPVVHVHDCNCMTRVTGPIYDSNHCPAGDIAETQFKHLTKDTGLGGFPGFPRLPCPGVFVTATLVFGARSCVPCNSGTRGYRKSGGTGTALALH